MGAMGVDDDPTLHYASSKAKAEALVRESGLDWTILKPSLQFGEGDGFFNIIAGLVRLSPGVVPVPGDGSSRFQPIHVGDVAAVVVRSLADPTTIGGTFELGGPRYWTYREITREVLAGARQAAGHPADAGPAHPARGRDRGARSTSRSRSPPTSSASCKLDNIGPLDVIPSRFGFEPRPMEGALGYLKDQAARPGRQAGPTGRSGAARMTRLRSVVGGAHLGRDHRGHRARRGRPRHRARPPARVAPAATGPDRPGRRRGHPAARRGRGGIRGARRPGRCARARRRGPRSAALNGADAGRRRGRHRSRAIASSSGIIARTAGAAPRARGGAVCRHARRPG